MKARSGNLRVEEEQQPSCARKHCDSIAGGGDAVDYTVNYAVNDPVNEVIIYGRCRPREQSVVNLGTGSHSKCAGGNAWDYSCQIWDNGRPPTMHQL